MDEIVRQAMSKWPHVADCFGWLRLDARGHWRLRDQHAQQLGLPGDKLNHPALLDFINRNYACDAIGQWYFQNGPQRVYVDLELTPYIVRTDPGVGLLLHTGDAMPMPSQAWLTPQGQFLLLSGKIVAALDDRDSAAGLAALRHAQASASDAQIMAWLDGENIPLSMRYADVELPLQRSGREPLAQCFDFVAHPRAQAR